MPPSELLNTFLNGNPPRNLKIAFARGAAPLPTDELLQILVHLAEDAEPEVALEASKTIKALPEDELLVQVQARECSISVLDYFAHHSQTQSVLEGIILNPSTPPALVEAMAARVPEPLVESILYNRVRILECPGILAQLKLNPSITPAIDRQIREIELEFFGGKRTEYSVASKGSESRTEEESVQQPEAVQEPDVLPEDLVLEGLPVDPQQREIAIGERLAKMTVPERVRYALHGSREARAVLIRDPNKEVARSVLKSPKLSESEIQAFAAMRNIPDDLLRVIGESRQWTRNYSIVQNLIKNPKTPPMTAVHLINRLHSKDLLQLTRDRAVSEGVRRNAQRMLVQRNSKGTTS